MPETTRNRRAIFAKSLAVLLQYSLSAILIYSALGKLQYPTAFLESIYSYGLIDSFAGLAAAVILPCLELVIGIALLTGVFAGGALMWAFLLFPMFLFFQVYAFSMDLGISCGCFNPVGGEIIGYSSILRTFVMMVVSWVLFALYSYRALRLDAQNRLTI